MGNKKAPLISEGMLPQILRGISKSHEPHGNGRSGRDLQCWVVQLLQQVPNQMAIAKSNADSSSSVWSCSGQIRGNVEVEASGALVGQPDMLELLQKSITEGEMAQQLSGKDDGEGLSGAEMFRRLLREKDD